MVWCFSGLRICGWRKKGSRKKCKSGGQGSILVGLRALCWLLNWKLWNHCWEIGIDWILVKWRSIRLRPWIRWISGTKWNYLSLFLFRRWIQGEELKRILKSELCWKRFRGDRNQGKSGWEKGIGIWVSFIGWPMLVGWGTCYPRSK